jgi:sugar/nucleoside kinase (ribokinase family)
MKILVIGHSVEDHIHQNNKEEVKPGGIYYSALGLSKIISADDEIHLVTALQKSNQHLFSDLYDKINNNNISWVDEIPKVHLIIHDSEERTECYENISENLKVDYSVLQSFDGILVNMITGFDISLEQLKQIRKHFKGLIYFDVHTLSRGITENKTRVFRQIPRFSEWVSSVDLIQANEMEKKTFFNYEDELQIASEVLKFGPKVFIVTKGDACVIAYYKEQNKVESIYVPAEKAKTNNKVGLGDIFGSVFFYNYLITQNVKESLTAANNAAGHSASVKSLNELNLKS